MKKVSFLALISVMFTFFTMGFVDLVGIATNYVKEDFMLSDTMANLLPSMVFLWFLILGVPTGLLMNRIGRKNTVLLSLAVTLPSLLLPLIDYSFATMLVSFTLLGIGNTLMQVSLNPLVTTIVAKDKMASTLTFGQFVKAIASFIAPILAAWAVVKFGDWRMILFPAFAIITVAVIVLLFLTPIQEETPEAKNVSVAKCFSLLGNATILIFFLGIMAHVGLDVGINTTAPKILMERLGITLAEAGFATSFYFIFRTAGCLLGSVVLAKFPAKSVFIASAAMILAGIAGLFTADKTIIYLGIALFGLGNANIFPIIFSQALVRKPEMSNEVSGLMIMGIFGGALIPLIMGVFSDMTGGQAGAVAVLAVCSVYLLGVVVPSIKKI